MVAIFALEDTAFYRARDLAQAGKGLGRGFCGLAYRWSRIGARQPSAKRTGFLGADSKPARTVQKGHDGKIGPAEIDDAEPVIAGQFARQPIIKAQRLRRGAGLKQARRFALGAFE